jgi:hypothetical protein
VDKEIESRPKTRRLRDRRRVKHVRNGGNRCRNQMRTRQAMQAMQAAKGPTYDWALDLEPLALPPDLPPVILKELVVVVVEMGLRGGGAGTAGGS